MLRGVTQGVGFRPTVFRYARFFALTGFIRNDSDGVTIEIQGAPGEVARFEGGLDGALPRLARIDVRESADVAPLGDTAFVIVQSGDPRGGVPPIPADIATCPECLAELSDPANRRYRYPFVTCTLCGPRFTIVRGAPYDRDRTSMAPFTQCPACAREYADPADRRFHSETNSCPACGPMVTLCGPSGATLAVGWEAITGVAAAIAAGKIAAIRGVGGFHLACDAMNESAIATLRARKGRAEKPFAVMVADIEAALGLVNLTAEDAHLLRTPVSPIVVAPRKDGCPLPASVAPGNPTVGIFVAYSPLHRLVFDALAGCAAGPVPHAPVALVMTSGNRSDEPIAITNEEALSRLAGIADLFLLHDREILCRADDSIYRRIGGAAVTIRRARGIVPEGIKAPVAGPDVLALGGELKNTIAVLAGDCVYPSPHIGDLETAEAFDHFKASITMMQEFTGCRPEVVACDMHPEYLSTKHAETLPVVRLVKVQHHHAHVAACMAEHGLAGEVIGVAFDGTGYGPDGTAWGGEFLVAGYDGFRRAGHLKPVAMPGGAQAIREPYRMAASFLAGAFDGPPPPKVLENLGIDDAAYHALRAVSQAREFSPLTSGAGRLFDAVAVICGLGRVATFEGQAAMALEAAAASAGAVKGSYRGKVRKTGGRYVLDTVHMIRQVAVDISDRAPVPAVAMSFHAALSAAVLGICVNIKNDTGIDRVVLSGGVFQNAIFTELCQNALGAAGLAVFSHARLPPNDGGIAAGQALVAREVVRCASPYRCE